MPEPSGELVDLFVRDLDRIELPPRERWRPTPRKKSYFMKSTRYVLYAGVAAAVLAVAVIAGLGLGTRNTQVAASPTPIPATSTPSPASSPPATPSPVATTSAPTGQPGAISGRLGYPSEFIPPLTVYAISTLNQRVWFSVETPRYPLATNTPPQPSYTISGVAPGSYYVVAYRNDGLQPDPGAYTRRVACRTGPAPTACGEDTSLAIVTVNAGQTTTSITVEDWSFLPPGPSLPPRPTPR